MMASPESPSTRGDEESGEDRRETAGEEEAYKVPEPIAGGSKGNTSCAIIELFLVSL